MQQLQALLVGPSLKTSPVLLEISQFSLGKRLWRATFRFTLLMICAACSVVVPMLHFVLPFLLAAIAVYLGLRAYNEKISIRSGHGNCPECNEQMQIYARPYKFPSRDICEKCRREITIQK